MQDMADHLARTMKRMNNDFPHFGKSTAHMESSQDWWSELVYNTFKGTSFGTATGSPLKNFTGMQILGNYARVESNEYR